MPNRLSALILFVAAPIFLILGADSAVWIGLLILGRIELLPPPVLLAQIVQPEQEPEA